MGDGSGVDSLRLALDDLALNAILKFTEDDASCSAHAWVVCLLVRGIEE
jgi:hypothetical protein